MSPYLGVCRCLPIVKIMIERSDVVPYWWIIRDEIRKRIITGQYGPSFKISEGTLAQEFDTTRTTVRKAMQYLRDEGLIETIKGVGSHSIYNSVTRKPAQTNAADVLDDDPQ